MTQRYEDSTVALPKIILNSSIVAACLLSLILLIHSIYYQLFNRPQLVISILCIVYLFTVMRAMNSKKLKVANWMLIVFYQIIGLACLFFWGINSPVGMILECLSILLSSVLIGINSLYITAFSSGIAITIIQFIHNTNLFTPNIERLSVNSSYWDVFIYIIIIFIFATLSWLSGKQIEKNFLRAANAEKLLKRQNESIQKKLQIESLKLRKLQLKEIQQLYKFALIGQQTSATLHELSNYLSIINLDLYEIDDNKNIAFENMKENILSINAMVKHARKTLDNYQFAYFEPYLCLKQVLRDFNEKVSKKNIDIRFEILKKDKSIKIYGNKVSFAQIFTILLNNSVEALSVTVNPRINLLFKVQDSNLLIEHSDNGPGIPKNQQKNVFLPKQSKKTDGLGVGLYIAKHLTTSSLKGSIKYFQNSPQGACFRVIIPLSKSI